MANTVSVHLRQTAASTSEAVIREHHLLIDRPTAKGGSDRGPMGGELFLAAIGGCFMSNLLAAIKARAAGVSGVRREVTATIEESPARFTAVELSVMADHPDPESFQRLVDIAARGCIMLNSLQGSRIDLQIR